MNLLITVPAILSYLSAKQARAFPVTAATGALPPKTSPALTRQL